MATRPRIRKLLRVDLARIALLFSIAAILLVGSGAEAGFPYADTSWNGAHGNSQNNNYVPTEVAPRLQRKWYVLEDAAVLFGPSVGPEGNIYVTTGREPGHSNFYALDPNDGSILWQTPPWADANDFDACAVYSAAIVDENGDVYVGDCNQLWSFASDGTVNWVADLPTPPLGSPWQEPNRSVAAGGFVTAFFTKDGSVGGITLFGDIAIYNRADGTPAAPVAVLPGTAGTITDIAPPPGIWSGGLVDPDVIIPMWTGFQGGTPAANTIAVDPDTGRIFTSGWENGPLTSAMHAIDFTPGPGGTGIISIAWSTPFNQPIGNSSTPALSPDGSVVYSSAGDLDVEGDLHAFDAANGTILWAVDVGSGGSGPAVGPDGTIYVRTGAGLPVAVDPNGTTKWISDDAQLRAYASTLLPPSPDPELDGPTVFGNAVPAITDNMLLMPATVGYKQEIEGISRPLPLSVYQALLPLDPDTGLLLEGFTPHLRTDGSSEGFVGPDFDGSIYFASGALIGSVTEALKFVWDPIVPDEIPIMEVGIGGVEKIAPAPETPQNKDQQKCINELNKNFAKVAKAQGKAICKCIKDGSKGQLTGTIETCLTADVGGKVAKAQNKTVSKESQKCTTPPDFGATDATTVNQVSVQKELDLIHAIFGSDLDTGVIIDFDADKDGSKCQTAAAKASKKCQDAKLKAFNSCKKDGLKGKLPGVLSFDQVTDLEDECLGAGPNGIPDPKSKITKACETKLDDTIGKKCAGNLDVFPGCNDPNAPGTPQALADCLDRLVECKVCLAINQADNLARNCDLFDDGTTNGSCP